MSQHRPARGVLRGLHYQSPGAQGKLVRVVRGAVFDVAVDMRRASPQFGQWFGAELSADNQRMMWVPAGFAHGFLTLADDTDFLYKCTAPYNAAAEQCLAWNDPSVGVVWPLDGIDPQLSDKDRLGRALADAVTF
jgi:dTDP-4-dehydrorhamnose 3,5-epimerase